MSDARCNRYSCSEELEISVDFDDARIDPALSNLQLCLTGNSMLSTLVPRPVDKTSNGQGASTLLWICHDPCTCYMQVLYQFKLRARPGCALVRAATLILCEYTRDLWNSLRSRNGFSQMYTRPNSLIDQLHAQAFRLQHGWALAVLSMRLPYQ